MSGRSSAAAARPLHPVRSAAAAPTKPLRVLVVDDDEDARRALQAVVLSLGHRCRVARDGREALEKRRESPVDVIISDCCMPEIDGFELCRRVRTDEGDSYVYFIFATGLDDKESFLQGMDAGADDYLTKPIDLDELRARLVVAWRVCSRHRDLADTNSSLRRDSEASFLAARVDPLTGVANRLRLHEDLEALWSHKQRYGHRCSAAICDIDFFKLYNDAFGHVTGDEALQRVAGALRKHVRRGDGLYRYGGEEFLMILPEQPAQKAKAAMERVRREVERLAMLHAPSAPMRVLTISIGVAELGNDPSPEAWIQRADAALYRAKACGRNRVEVDPAGAKG